MSPGFALHTLSPFGEAPHPGERMAGAEGPLADRSPLEFCAGAAFVLPVIQASGARRHAPSLLRKKEGEGGDASFPPIDTAPSGEDGTR